MGRSNIETDGYKSKVTVNENVDLGVYTFIDDDGNVTQIKKTSKDKIETERFYTDELTAPDEVLDEIFVIGVTDDIAMGIGDNTMAYSKYL